MRELPRAGSVLREVSAGFVAACLTLPLCVGAGVLAYAPMGRGAVARGAVAGLVCAVVGGVTAALVRRSSFVATYPTTPICVIQASFVGSLAASAGGDVSRVAAAVTLCVVLAGLLQAAFALSGISRILRFVPHPVMGGFVSGVAVLIAWHQLPALLGGRVLPGPASLSPVFSPPPVALFGAALLAAILLCGRIAPKAPSLLLGLLFGSAAFHFIGAVLPGVDLGATVGKLPLGPAGLVPLLDRAAVEGVLGSLALLRVVVVGAVTLAVVGTLDTFFALRTAELLADIPVDPRRDVFGQGVANVFSALVGGLAVSTSLSVTSANYRAGGRTRLSTLASGATLLVGGLLFPPVVTRLPLVVLGAILLAVAIGLVDRWSLQTLRSAVASRDPVKRRQATRDAAVVLAVFLATLLGEPVAGVGAGVILSCILFTADLGRPVVAGRSDGAAFSFGFRRGRAEHTGSSVSVPSGSVYVLELQGALFFGNCHGFAAELRAMEGGARVLVLDCRRLADVDASGRAVLAREASRLGAQGRELVFAGSGRVDPPLGRSFGSVDEAVEWARERMAPGELEGRDGVSRPVHGVPGARETMRLLESLRSVRIRPGAFLCREGDPSDAMWILRRGTVRVRRPGPSPGPPLARLGPGCTVGEMGLLEGRPRSADVVAEDDVEAWVLSAGELGRLLAEDPPLGQAILALAAGQLSRRLREATELADASENCA